MWCLLIAHTKQPFLGFLQIASAQKQTPILSLAFPLLRTHEETRMGMNPIEVDIHRCNQRFDLFVELVWVKSVNPVELAQGFVNLVWVDIPAHDWDDSLVLRQRVLQFLTADPRSNGIGAEYKYDSRR